MSEQTTGHTPTPWAVGDDGEGLWWVGGPDKNANVICDIVPRGKPNEPNSEDYANACLIVQAVNSYASSQRLAQLVTLAPLQHGIDIPDELMRLALAALNHEGELNRE